MRAGGASGAEFRATFIETRLADVLHMMKRGEHDNCPVSTTAAGRIHTDSRVGQSRRDRAARRRQRRQPVAQHSFSPMYRAEPLERRVLLSGSVVINEIHYNPDV